MFEDTDLYYGDVFGAAPTSSVSFEVDGLDYTFRDGLPYPTFTDGAPPSTEILAMAPAIKGEEDRSRGQNVRTPQRQPARRSGPRAPGHLPLIRESELV